LNSQGWCGELRDVGGNTPNETQIDSPWSFTDGETREAIEGDRSASRGDHPAGNRRISRTAASREARRKEDCVSKPYTLADAEEYGSSEHIALHESCHAVAAWMLGMRIVYTQLNCEGSGSPDFTGETLCGDPPEDYLRLPIGERFVKAHQHAFITLAGQIGSGQAFSGNPLDECSAERHWLQAGAEIVILTGASDEAAGETAGRLFRHVVETFADERVQAVTRLLAEQLLKMRRLTGEQAKAILSQAWGTPSHGLEEA